jgi:hypothetical protein
MTVVQSFEVMLGQTLTYFVYNFVMLCNVMPFKTIYLVITKIDKTVFSWYDNGIILKPHFHFILYQRCFEY